MKVTDAEQVLLRTFPQRSKWYLGVERGVTMMSARVDGNHALGDTTILLKDVTFPTGMDATDLVRGMTVSLHLAAVNDRRVDAAFLAYDTGTKILTISPNTRTCDDDYYVTVYSSMKLWRVDEPAWDGEQHYPPFAVIGPARAGFTDEPLNFIGANSYSPIGLALSSPQWKFFQDETIESGTVNDIGTVTSPVVVSWASAGEKLVRFRIDDSDGERGLTYRPVLIFDRAGANAPYEEIIIRSCKWNGMGWSADFTVYGAADKMNDFPPQARVVLFAEDWYGATKQSIGGCLRGMGEIVFEGFIREGTTTVSAEDNSVSFTAVSVDALMARLAMPNFTLRDGNDTTNWHTFAGLNATKALLHLIQQHTTLAQVADVFTATFDYELDIVDVPQANLLAQVTQSILSKFGYAAGSRFGSITLARDKNLLTEEMRAGLKGSASVFAADDWLTLEIGEERFGSIAQVTLEGKDGADVPLRAVYPSSGFGHNGDVIVDSGWIFKNQTQADELAQLVYARGNRTIKHVSLRLPNYRVVEPAFQEFFSVTLPHDDNLRALNWTPKDFFATEMSIEWGDGFMTVTLGAEVSRFGDDGEGWDPDDNIPLEHVYGYDQNLTSDESTGINDAEPLLVDDDAINLLDVDSEEISQ